MQTYDNYQCSEDQYGLVPGTGVVNSLLLRLRLKSIGVFSKPSMALWGKSAEKLNPLAGFCKFSPLCPLDDMDCITD